MIKAFFYTAFALVCFAFNSILCRLALHAGEIDAASFTGIRLVSGAIILLPFVLIQARENRNLELRGNWLSAFFLFGYAVCFSFAYINLTTAAGALILFGSVQVTMLTVAIFKGERPRPFEWIGFALAIGGLFYLVFPGLSAPPVLSSLLMCLAGITWGFYTLRGKAATNPLAETTGNFIRAVPMVLVIFVLFIAQIQVSAKAILFAVLSGAIASGLGYSVWYAALKFHTATRAAILQLSVPVIAAVGGILFLSEEITTRLFFAAALILGGIGLKLRSEK